MTRYMPIFAATLITLCATSVAQAYNSEQFGSIRNGQKECPKCDLAGADLRGADLTNVNMAGADLTGADLSRARLDGAKLQGATFKSARLDEVDLTMVDLSDANLDKAWCGESTKLAQGAKWSCIGVVFQRK